MPDCYGILREKILNLGTEKYFIMKGVLEEDIIKSKSQFSSNESQLYNYHDYNEEFKEDVLVPIKDIYGVSRVIDYPWFEILNYSLMGVAQTKYKLNIEQYRFLKLLLLLEENGLKRFQDMLNHTGNVHFIAFRNRDEVKYFQCTDGNHRVILAKVTGLETIRAKKIYYYEYNAEKFKLFESFIKAESKLLEFVNKTQFTFVNDKESGMKKIVLEYEKFNNTNNIIFKYFFDKYKFRENPYYVNDMIDRMDEIQVQITKINQKSSVYLRIFRLVPKNILVILKYINRNECSVNSLAKMIALKKRMDS